MRTILSIIICLILAFPLSAQDIIDMSFGTDSTLEVITWNIERFPKNGQVTVEFVTQIVQALDPDLVALQEIDEEWFFDILVSQLDGWDGFYDDQDFTGLAYLYKPDVIDVHSIFQIYGGSGREFPREPLVMEMYYEDELYVIINNHLKCCGDGFLEINDPGDEETRRFDASNSLEHYIRTTYPGQRLIMLGDLNDILIDNESNNVFEVFLQDPDNYKFADMEIAEAGSHNWSYPNWPSHLDHILLTNELFEAFSAEGSAIETIRVDDYLPWGFQEYDQNISDHRPVAMRLNTDPDIVSTLDITANPNLIQNFPNPFRGSTTITLGTGYHQAQLGIFDVNGRMVDQYPLLPDQNLFVWRPHQIPEGVYYARLIINNRMVAIRKMVLID